MSSKVQFVAYFDDGGHTSDSPVISVAAVTAQITAWEQFNAKWAKRLRRAGILAFHMTDYENRKKGFENWAEDKRLALITDLAAILKNSIACGVGATVMMKDWLAVMPAQFERPDFIAKRGPYPLLFQLCVEHILSKVNLDSSQKLDCVFDKNIFIRGSLEEHHRDVLNAHPYSAQLGKLTFDTADKTAPLQAADILAYEGHKHIKNQVVEGGHRPERKLHAMLRRSERIEYFTLTERSLNDYCDAIRESESRSA